MTILLKTISGEMGMEARVLRVQETGKYRAELWDMDAQQMAGYVLAPSYEAAVVKARYFVGA